MNFEETLTDEQINEGLKCADRLECILCPLFCEEKVCECVLSISACAIAERAERRRSPQQINRGPPMSDTQETGDINEKTNRT